MNNAKDEVVHAAKVPARKLIAVRIAKGVEKFSCGSIHHKNRKEVKMEVLIAAYQSDSDVRQDGCSCDGDCSDCACDNDDGRVCTDGDDPVCWDKD